MINKCIILFVACSLQLSVRAADNSQLTDGQLTRIQFDQELGAQVSPALEFKAETGKAVRMGDYCGGKPAVLILGYYGCPMLCTLVLNGAADCFRNMKWKAGQQFNVVFVSIDPSETPSLAAEKKLSYIRSYGTACAGSWHFLTGNQNSISNLAAEIGFNYAYDPAVKQFAHPSGLVILSADGKVARYFFGVYFSAKDVDSALRDAAVNKAGPPESSFTLLCFHYSPVHGKYGKLVMAIVRSGGLLVLTGLACLVLRPPGGRKKEKTK